MRNLITSLFIFISISYYGQTPHSHTDQLKKRLPVVPNYIFNSDSLIGFDYDNLKSVLLEENFNSDDTKRYTYLRKRKFIDEKYLIGSYKIPSISSSSARLGGGPTTTAAFDCPTENFDFENGTGSGWALTGNTSIVAGGVDPYGGFPNVYPGGTRSLKISSDVAPNGDWGQAVKTINVPATGTTLFTFHYAMAIFNFPHTAADAARFNVVFRDAANNIIGCPRYSCFFSSDLGAVGATNFTATPNSATFYNPAAVGAGPGTYGVTSAAWNNVTMDLSAYAGQVITATFRIDWCVYTPDWAYCIIDADCPTNNLDPIPVCGGAGQVICGPTSMSSYTWTRPGGATATTSCITTTSSGTHTLECVPSGVQCSAAPVLKYLYIVNATPIADFNYTVTPCTSNLVPFVDNTNLNGGGAITSYTWNYGDGSPTGSTSNPTHLYSSSGTKTVELTVTNGTCSDNIIKTFNLTIPPVANFSATSVCQSTATAFTDLSTTPAGVINAWSWDFTNNGSADNLTQNPTFTYPSSGTFTAALTVTNSDLCTSTKTLVVDVWGHSIPNFSPNGVCYGTATTFSNSTDFVTNANVGGVPNYTWNFADATATVSTTDPSHTYVLGGNVNATYNVTLTATSSHGCVDNIVKPVNVYATPTASFTSDEVCFGSQTHLLDASNGNGNALSGYVWDFSSNGTVDITGVPNPNFTFPSVGNNPVTYTVFTNPSPGLLCSNVTSTINVWVNPGPNPNFTFVNNCVNAQPNSFDASSSTISIGTNTAYAWAYGDAGSGSGAATTHTYALASTYNVTLTVTSDKGCVASVVKPVEVYEKPMATILNSNACDQKAMTFTASTLPGSGTITIWSWDYNNTIATLEALGQNSSFIFPAAGSQTVNMIAETNHGCKETFTKVVYVDYVPVPLFSVNTPSGCPTHCVTFSDNTLPITAPGVNADWKWVFGDGSTLSAATGANQIHCYQNTTSNQVNQFDVKLVVTTNKGCSDSLLKTNFITVFPKPIADFTVSPNPGSIVTPLESFTNESIDYTSWIWEFGDNTAKDSTNRNPTHVYDSPNAQDYVSYLIVSNQYGCKDTAVAKVELKPDFVFYMPNAFTPDNQDGLNDVFTGNGIGIAKYEMWIFDRWGSSIYYSDDIRKGWNGKVQSKEKDCPQDVYIWKVKLVDVLGKKHDYVGHVTLVK